MREVVKWDGFITPPPFNITAMKNETTGKLRVNMDTLEAQASKVRFERTALRMLDEIRRWASVKRLEKNNEGTPWT
jgi:hypothetical protein